jgi:PAS domain S-box-containing protein
MRDFRVVYTNAPFLQGLGFSPEQLRAEASAIFSRLLHPEDAPRMRGFIGEVLRASDEQVLAFQFRVQRPGESKWLYMQMDARVLTRDEAGAACVLLGVVRDVTAERDDEVTRAELETAFLELSTPLLPIAMGVVAMPIIGRIDALRSQQILEVLLEGIMQQQALVAILDITGGPRSPRPSRRWGRI